MKTYRTHTPEQTLALAEALADYLRGGELIALDGDLGAGKTVFSKGIAAGLGVSGHVTSPTFIIMQEYTDGRLPLAHFDVYRIEDPEELFEIGAEEYFHGDGVCLVEWASRAEDLLPEDRIRVQITRDPDGEETRRLIRISGTDPETEAALAEQFRDLLTEG